MDNEVYKVSETWDRGMAMRGVPMEDVLKIAAAFQEERIVILPVKEGTKCYRRGMDCDGYVPDECDGRSCSECNHLRIIAIETEFSFYDLPVWGVSVFRTAQEAEAVQPISSATVAEGYADQSGLAPAT